MHTVMSTMRRPNQTVDARLLQMGIRQFSMVAQFGDIPMMKTGVDEELNMNNYQVTLHQGSEEAESSQVVKIEYTWKKYETE